MISKRIVLALAFAAAALTPAAAAAMCGCMMPVDDTGIPESTRLTSDATQVVLMRHGTTTIQTMQNRYEGPLANFAIVIPTPQVLSEESVKTLNPGVFEAIDRASAPTLTEYWQHDPCEQVDGFGSTEAANEDGSVAGTRDQNNQTPPSPDPGVVVEAEFQVGEYQIQVLSAEQGIGLEVWLNDNGYRVPQGASKYLQPYIDSGMYFFVAKVDVEEVSFVDGEAVLSPLRFHYETPDLTLPTRLGMVNSNGRQDLIVYALGERRYEAANLANATIPTNVAVSEQVKNDFGSFYDQLFEKTLEAHGTSVVTEYAGHIWNVQPEHVASVGGDVMSELYPEAYPYGFVLSRLHLRYAKDDFGEDLVFRATDGLEGGMEMWNERTVDPTMMEQGTRDTMYNNFRAHYFIAHAWNGPVDCANPASRWGGNPDGEVGSVGETYVALSPNTTNEKVFKDDGKWSLTVEELVTEDIPEIGLKQEAREKATPSTCSSARSAGDAIPVGALALLLGFAGIARRRR